MIIVHSQVVHNRGHDFSKRFIPAGVYNVKVARFPRDLPASYPRVPSGSPDWPSSGEGRRVGAVRPLQSMRLSKGHRDDRTSLPSLFQPLPHRPSYHHHHHHHLLLFHHQPHTRKWKAQTRGPLDTPALIIRLVRSPYSHLWKHARFLFRLISTHT